MSHDPDLLNDMKELAVKYGLDRVEVAIDRPAPFKGAPLFRERIDYLYLPDLGWTTKPSSVYSWGDATIVQHDTP